MPTRLLCWKGGCLFHFSEGTLKAAEFKVQAGHALLRPRPSTGTDLLPSYSRPWSSLLLLICENGHELVHVVAGCSSQQTRKQVKSLTRVGGCQLQLECESSLWASGVGARTPRLSPVPG